MIKNVLLSSQSWGGSSPLCCLNTSTWGIIHNYVL